MSDDKTQMPAMEKTMQKRSHPLRSAAIAAFAALLAFAVPSLAPAPAMAQADVQSGVRANAGPAPNAHRKAHLAKRRYAPVVRQANSNPPPSSLPPGCTWPYRNMAPPCMSTWPAGDPNYHGPVPGPAAGP
jgi:hypothetical protein